MQLKPSVKPWSKRGLQQMLLVALCYGTLLLLTKLVDSLLPYYNIRFATFVPIVGTFVFGLPGALGAALGNFLGGAIGSTALSVRLAAAFDNFLLAYLPYRLWYIWQGTEAPLFIHNKRSFLRFTILLACGASLFAIILCATFSFIYGHLNDPLANCFILFCNNFLTPFLVGLPLLLWLQKKQRTFYYPPSYNPPSVQANNFLSFAASISSKLLFLTTCVILVGTIILMAVHGHVFNNNIFINMTNWLDIYIKLLGLLVCVIIALYAFLGQLEKQVIEPLALLSKQASNFKPSNIATAPLEATPHLHNEIDILAASFAKMSGDVQHYLHNLTLAKEQEHALQAQLDVATQIQQGSLPDLNSVNHRLKACHWPYTVQGSMEAARNVGGDMFDCFPLGDKHLFFCIGDVSGKGIPAALFAMVTQALLVNTALDYKYKEAQIATIVAHANAALAAHNQEILFVTLWAGILDLETGILSYVNAGHNPPLLYDVGTGQTTWIEELSGPVLGLIPDAKYTARSITLPERCRLLLYTDGFNEAENRKQEFFGNDRLLDGFIHCENGQQLLDKVKAFVNDAPPSDDKTCVWLERK